MSAPRKHIVVLISGSGSNLQAIIDACRAGDYPAQVAGVVSNCSDAFGLKRAERAGIPYAVVDHRHHPSRESFDAALQVAIDQWQPDVVALAGFMRILTPALVNRYAGRMLNIHPSLLPLYPGLHTHRRALAANDTEHGATVHFVTQELDGGPPVVHARVSVHSDDTEQSLATRVLEQEHRLYPLAIRWLALGDLCLRDGTAYLRDQPIPAGGVPLASVEA